MITLTKGKRWEEQIKPFNFFYLGFQMVRKRKKTVKPLAPYSKDSQTIIHEPFIDYEVGKIKQGLQYWKPLSKTILQYFDHPEAKLDGETGLLLRKHIHADCVIHIGKEANDIEDQPLEVKRPQEFTDREEWKQKILLMRQCDAERLGIARVTRWRMKKI